VGPTGWPSLHREPFTDRRLNKKGEGGTGSNPGRPSPWARLIWPGDSPLLSALEREEKGRSFLLTPRSLLLLLKGGGKGGKTDWRRARWSA